MCLFRAAAGRDVGRGDGAMAYRFLSDEWFDAVEALRDRAPTAPEEVADIAVNMIVTGGPDGDRTLHFAEGRFDRGLVEGAPTTVTVPHRVARSMLVDLDPEVAINAFFTGEIRVEGDITRLIELTQSSGAMLAATPEQLAFIGELRELTE